MRPAATLGVSALRCRVTGPAPQQARRLDLFDGANPA
jgi:hypothetical protein